MMCTLLMQHQVQVIPFSCETGLLPPATKLGQGNIFRSVCQEFCSHPGAVQAGRYGQQAGGMHPTGMHTCFYGQVCLTMSL